MPMAMTYLWRAVQFGFVYYVKFLGSILFLRFSLSFPLIILFLVLGFPFSIHLVEKSHLSPPDEEQNGSNKAHRRPGKTVSFAPSWTMVFPSLKLTASLPLKIKGLVQMNFFLGQKAYFQGRTVSFGEANGRNFQHVFVSVCKTASCSDS